VEKLRYLHRNPVRRGLVERPEQWKWSSFRAYACGETEVVRVNDWSVLKLKPTAPKTIKTRATRPGSPNESSWSSVTEEMFGGQHRNDERKRADSQNGESRSNQIDAAVQTSALTPKST
jgi:hypothetical protein